MTTIADVRLDAQQLLIQVAREKDTVRIASLSAGEAQDIRIELLGTVRKLTEELYEVRNAEHLAEEGQVHVYRALATIIRLQNSILGDASLDEIQALLEDAYTPQTKPLASASGTKGGHEGC